jgi:hypothetical protein
MERAVATGAWRPKARLALAAAAVLLVAAGVSPPMCFAMLARELRHLSVSSLLSGSSSCSMKEKRGGGGDDPHVEAIGRQQGVVAGFKAMTGDAFGGRRLSPAELALTRLLLFARAYTHTQRC